MEFDKVKAAKEKLDAAVGSASPHIGVKFGVDLYTEFWRRRYFKIMPFCVVGLPHVQVDYPTYSARAATCDPDIGLEDFVVGSDPSA